MMGRILILSLLLLSACASEPPKRVRPMPVEPQVTFKEFPNKWDGGVLEYAVAIDMPIVKGMTKVEAEKLKKFYVLNGLNHGLGLLFSLANPNHESAKEDDSFFSELKEGTGKLLSALVYAPTANQAELSSIHLDTQTNRLVTEFRPLSQSGQSSVIVRVKPNQKLSELFQASGPNVSPSFIGKVENSIEKKLEPYDIQLTPGGADEPTELTSLGQQEANDDESVKLAKPHWLTHVDKSEGSLVWGYLMLYHAKIEAEPKNKSGMVIFKITVNMSDVLKSAKAEKYDDYLAK